MEDIPPVDRAHTINAPEHPLLSKKIGAALALLVFTAFGIALISIDAFVFGFLVSLFAPAGIIWIYWRDLAPLKHINSDKITFTIEGIIAVVLTIVAIFAPVATYVAVEQNLAANDLIQLEIGSARRWIRLSDDILTDVVSVKNSFKTPTFSSDMAKEIRERLWHEETQRSLDSFQQGLAMLAQKYAGRIAEAEIEMQKQHIPLVQNGMNLSGPLVNTFSYEAWASKLAGEGHRILTQYGQGP
jgi:hypothetical protein